VRLDDPHRPGQLSGRFATNHSRSDAGSLYAQAGVDIKRIDEAISTVHAELKKIAAEAVTADELRKNEELREGQVGAADRAPSRADHVGLRCKRQQPEEVLAGLDAVTAEDVQRVAQKLVDDQALRLADIRPFRGPGALRAAAGRLIPT
jgi:predicted Zn-dependent peptidase